MARGSLMSGRSTATTGVSAAVLGTAVLLLVLVLLWTRCPQQFAAFDGSDGFVMTSEPADAIGVNAYLTLADRVSAVGEGTTSIALDPTFGEIGVFGATLADTCDVALMITHLTVDDPDAGQRWATAAGVPVNDIADHLGGLRADVLVAGGVYAMNGDADGQRTAETKLLAPGTAVLADADGVARVRCLDANPLTASIDVASALASQPGADLFSPPTTGG